MADDAGPPIIEAPRSGKRVRYLKTADRTGGEYARFEMWLAPPPASHGPMKHIHPKQDEYLEVRDGILGIWHAGTTHRLWPGNSITIPTGDPHQFWNAGEEELHLIGEVRPALRTEPFMYITYGLGRDYPATPSGMPLNPLRLTPILNEYDDLLYLAFLPVWLQRLGVQCLAPIGRLLGYTAEYPEYIPHDRSNCVPYEMEDSDTREPTCNRKGTSLARWFFKALGMKSDNEKHNNDE